MRFTRRQVTYIATGFVAGGLGLAARNLFTDYAESLRDKTEVFSTPELEVATPPEQHNPWNDIANLYDMPNNLPIVIVRWVIDGSKFVCEKDGQLRVVRLIACDAPNSELNVHQTDCGFFDSKLYLESLLASGHVRLQLDDEETDSDDRIWAHVWIEDQTTSSSYLANSRMIYEGFAAFRREEKNAMYGLSYLTAFEESIVETAGLHSTCNGFHVPADRLGSDRQPAAIGTRAQVKGVDVTLKVVADTVQNEHRLISVELDVFNARENGEWKFKQDRLKLHNTESKNYKAKSDRNEFHTMTEVNLLRGDRTSGVLDFEFPSSETPSKFSFKVEGDYSIHWDMT